MAIDTKSTWGIGDGTASFYNYIYTLICSFSENDIFRSNQIREGMIRRKETLNSVYLENKPKDNSLKWYLAILGINYTNTINSLILLGSIFTLASYRILVFFIYV